MILDSEDVEYFGKKLSESDNAELKCFYLSRSLDRSSREDPFCLTPLIETKGPFCLLDLLPVARVIAADGRTLWECLSDSFYDCFSHLHDLWNEQIAVKVIYFFLVDRNKLETEADFLAELEGHLSRAIKPLPTTRPVRATREEASTDPRVVPSSSRYTSHVGLIPMENSPYSEGSIVCREPLRAFDDLLRIPRTFLFYRATVLAHSRLGRTVGSFPQFSSILENEEALLVLVLLYEKYIEGVHSHWKDILDACPGAYPTVASYWSFQELAEIEGVDVVDEVLSRRALLNQFHSQIKTLTPSLYACLNEEEDCGVSLEEFCGIFSEERLQWARTTFDSRAFNLNIDDQVVLCLVPLADMINHQNRTDALIRRVMPEDGDFVLQVGAGLEAGEEGRELWMSYGPLQNWELLLFYGFVLEDNEHDKLPFPLDFPSKESTNEWDQRRGRIAEMFGLLTPGRCWLPYDGVPCSALLALLRLLVAEAEEFPLIEEKGPFTALSPATEAAVLETVELTLTSVEGLFTTTLEEDQDTLLEVRHADEEENISYCLSLQLRIGLKEIIQRGLRYCSEEKQRLAALNG